MKDESISAKIERLISRGKFIKDIAIELGIDRRRVSAIKKLFIDKVKQRSMGKPLKQKEETKTISPNNSNEDFSLVLGLDLKLDDSVRYKTIKHNDYSKDDIK